MTAEEKKKAEEAAKAAEEAAKKAEEKKKADKAARAKKLSGTFIMKATHLSWGANNKNHFYSEKKPLISAKVMGKYVNTLELWIDNGWVEKGIYEKPKK